MRKFISTFLCTCIILLSMSCVAMASYSESLVITDVIEDSWIVDVKGDNLSDISDFSDKKYFLQNTEYSFHYDAYTQLDTAQKIIYNAVVANPGALTINVEFADGVFNYDNFTQAYFSELMDALCTDRPDIFYYAGYSIDGGYFHNNGKYVKSITYNIGVYDEALYTSYNLKGYYDALMNRVRNLASSNTFDLSNRYDFILSLHDYLADTVYYPDLNSSDYVMSAHDAYGALIEGRAVCQGYSDAVKLICDYYNIPCVCISGTANGGGHMWNGIQMDDGKWYLMDLTWDDQENNGTFYDFFLVGTETGNTYFGGSKFKDEHINDANLALPNLNYSNVKYNSSLNHFTAFGATYNSRFDSNNGYLELSVFDLNKSKVYFNGMYVGVDPYQGVSFSIEDENGNIRNYSVVVVGDPDGDDALTRYDYNIAADIAIGSDRFVDDVESAACDVNGDDVVDALDLALLHLGEEGLNTEYNLEG